MSIKISVIIALGIALSACQAPTPQSNNSAPVNTNTTTGAPSPCDLIKGKTYIGFVTGKYDERNLNAAGAAKFTFDSQGNGTGRTLLVYDPTTQIVQQQLPTITCTKNSDGTGVLNFWLGTNERGEKNDVGKTKFWVHDNGAKLWGEPTERSRPMDGWSLQLPEPPPAPPSQIQ
ncbi:MAG: hypothetical protein WBD16_03920 [Pyrinomonadaceae bacterium]